MNQLLVHRGGWSRKKTKGYLVQVHHFHALNIHGSHIKFSVHYLLGPV